MPKKTHSSTEISIEIQEHVRMWGSAVKNQRISQRQTAAQLAEQIKVSKPTVSRLEKGDAGISVGIYLSALFALGLRTEATPPLKQSLWQNESRQRMRPTFDEWGETKPLPDIW
ncbi:helix-turn-helix domain-containing protein [Zwartia sp.]|uniref:helix-turn-helix domain-containing protein n=1 Tax=Zwartia sp. TaxID=2978004 RepID=UPI003BAF9604